MTQQVEDDTRVKSLVKLALQWVRRSPIALSENGAGRTIEQSQDDTRVMSLVRLALAMPSEERTGYLKGACAGNLALFDQVWHYVQAEERMKGFLLEPLYSESRSSEYHLRPGEVLDGRFRIVREVAQGGMGVVYEAVDEKLERRIALKCGKGGYCKRLPPEVRTASEISHANVCKIFEIHSAHTSSGAIDFITMEFLDGETLATRLRRGPLPKREARVIALQICAGLAEAHRNSVIHGDLKAANVILTTGAGGQPRAVITDFGLARCSEASLRAARVGPRGGTPGYMAPELWRGEDASVASDLYALGVILYEMVAGHKPHDTPAKVSTSASTAVMSDGPSSADSWEERLARKPAPLHSKWDSVLARCLDPDPKRRFKNADEVIRALGPPRTRRRFLIAAAAVLLAAASSVTAYKWANAPKETVRLAVLPFAAGPNLPVPADSIVRDAASQIARLKSSPRTKLRVIPLDEILRKKVDSVNMAQAVVGATHALHGTLKGDRGKLILHAYLTVTRSGVNAKDWQAEYAPAQVRYAGLALAGIVTETLRLPPLPSTVNAAAWRDYVEGVHHLRNDSGVDAALASLERSVAADPDSPLVYAELSRAQWLKYSITTEKLWLKRAADSLQQAVQRGPDVPQVHIMEGVLKADEGWYEQAAAEFRRTIEIDPKNGDAYRRLGGVYEKNNQLEEALASLRQAIEVDPEHHRNHQAVGAFFFSRASYAEAVKHFKKSVELVPNEPYPHFSLAAAYQNLGRFGEAEQELLRSIDLHATPEALHTLGLVQMYQGRDQEAVSYLRRALRLDAQQYLVWSHLAIACRRLGRPAEEEQANRRGLELAEQEMARNPRSGHVRSHLAYFCARLGNRGRAESEIDQARQQSPTDANTLWMAVMTYETLGRRKDALDVLSSARPELLADLNRWPDAAALQRDPRFLELLVQHQIK